MEGVARTLMSYYGRDRVVRTLSFAAMLGAGSTSGKAAVRWGTLARQLSSARTVMRLFDDVIMLGATLRYGTGAQEKDPLTRILTLLINLTNQSFLPVEHVAWFAEQGILNMEAGGWWSAGIALWAISLTLGIIRSLRKIGTIRRKRLRVIKQKKLESPEPSGGPEREFQDSLATLGQQEMVEYLTLVKSIFDLLNAVSWLPKGFLWAGRLTLQQQGLFGTVASLAGIAISTMTPSV